MYKRQGDISENSEYDDAKNEQGMMEARIAEISRILSEATVVNAPKRSSKVNIGSTAVSYTHLDVYKRPPCFPWGASVLPRGVPGGSGGVSSSAPWPTCWGYHGPCGGGAHQPPGSNRG